MKTQPDDSLKTRALLAVHAQRKEKAKERAKLLRSLLASICNVQGTIPVEVRMYEEILIVTAQWEGLYFTATPYGQLALINDINFPDTCVPFSTLEHLGEILAVLEDVKQAPKHEEPARPWWKIW